MFLMADVRNDRRYFVLNLTKWFDFDGLFVFQAEGLCYEPLSFFFSNPIESNDENNH